MSIPMDMRPISFKFSRQLAVFASALVLTMSTMAQDTAPFWVLGSYSKASNAHSEQARLSEVLGIDVEIRFDEGLTVFRLVADAAKIDRAGLGEAPAWRIRLSATALAPNSTKQNMAAIQGNAGTDDTALSASPLETEPDPIDKTTQTIHQDLPDSTQTMPLLMDLPAPQPLFPAFNPHESLSEYCLRLPNAALCQHPRIEKALSADRKLMNHRREMLIICKKITDLGRRETCEQLHLAQ